MRGSLLGTCWCLTLLATAPIAAQQTAPPRTGPPRNAAPRTAPPQPGATPILPGQDLSALGQATQGQSPSSPSTAPRQPAAGSPATAAQNRAPSTAPRPTVSGGEQLRAIYRELTPQARSVEEFARIITECERVVDLALSENDRAYAYRLMAWAYDHRGEKLSSQGKDEQAMVDYDAALTLDPKRWQTYHNRGVSLAMLGKFDEAIADFAETIKLNPKHSNAWYNRAEIYYDQGKFADAVADYDEAIRLQPNDSELYNSRGHAFYRLGDYQAAIQDYSEAIRRDPQNAAAYTNRGDAQADLGQYGQASLDYRAAMRIDTKMGRVYQSAAWLMATCPDEHYRDADKAVKAARKAIELDGGEDPRYLDTLAAALASAGEYDEAQKALNEALTRAPNELVEAYRQRLDLYAAKQPYREPVPTTASAESAAPPPSELR